MSDVRAFSKKQKRAAYLLSKGLSMQSGKELGHSFHADHIVPYSKGGKTDMRNIQALTTEENLSKGCKFGPREWQKDALQKLAVHQSKYFNAEVVYGAGKTHFAMLAFLQQRTPSDILVVVVPTLSIKNSHLLDAAKMGLQLDPNWAGCGLSKDYHGIILTYAALKGLSASFQLLAEKGFNLCAVLDECHHNGDDKPTGQAIKEAFASARKVINLSGTFFRHDESIIHGGVVEGALYKPDFEYTYTDALRDGIVRPCKFDLYDAFVHLRDKEGIEFAITHENVKEKGMGWLVGNLEINRSMIHRAIIELNSKRNLKKNAGLMISCKDIQHANEVAKIWREIDGTEPLIATSDDSDSCENIELFKNGNQRCLISVKMVSEGVNIPRLCVILMLSACQTALFFRQLVGRGIRKESSDAPFLDCSVIAIKTDENEKHAREIEEQVRIGLEEAKEKTTRESAERSSQSFTVTSAGIGAQTLILSGEQLEQTYARKLGQVCSLENVSYTHAYAIIEAYKTIEQTNPTVEACHIPETTKITAIKRKEVGKIINKKINRLIKYSKETQREAHNRFNARIGVQGRKDENLTLEKLIQKHLMIENEIKIYVEQQS